MMNDFKIVKVDSQFSRIFVTQKYVQESFLMDFNMEVKAVMIYPWIRKVLLRLNIYLIKAEVYECKIFIKQHVIEVSLRGQRILMIYSFSDMGWNKQILEGSLRLVTFPSG